jgi:hemoglobin
MTAVDGVPSIGADRSACTSRSGEDAGDGSATFSRCLSTPVDCIFVTTTRTSLYARAGGMAFFERLVARFYEGVAGDPPLRALYPDDDLAPAQRRLTLFLAQYWGGPRTYEEERGHPRLRMRHAPFRIDAAQRDRWLGHMRAAIAGLEPSPVVAEELERYFSMAAESMRNHG